MDNKSIFWLSLWKQDSWERLNFYSIFYEVLKIIKIKKIDIKEYISKNLKFFQCFDIEDNDNLEKYLYNNWFELVWIYWEEDIELLKNLDWNIKQEIIDWKILISFAFKGIISDIQKIVLARVKLTTEEYNELVSKKIYEIFEKGQNLVL